VVWGPGKEQALIFSPGLLLLGGWLGLLFLPKRYPVAPLAANLPAVRFIQAIC
jgi:hypothetical protein